MKIHTVIVEDNKETREGLSAMLAASPDMDCVNTYEDAETLIKEISQLKADVVLMDINLPGQSGIQCIEFLKEIYPHIQFLVVTNFEDSDKIFAALRAGATGYLLKNVSKQKLHDAVRDIYNGGSPMSMQIARKIVNSFSGRYKNVKLFNSLTAREKEVLILLDKGYLYKEIAEKLSLKLETIRTYIRDIYEKLHVHSRTDAINKIYERNSIPK